MKIQYKQKPHIASILVTVGSTIMIITGWIILQQMNAVLVTIMGCLGIVVVILCETAIHATNTQESQS